MAALSGSITEGVSITDTFSDAENANREGHAKSLQIILSALLKMVVQYID